MYDDLPLKTRLWRRFLYKVTQSNPELANQLKYFRANKKFLDLKNPKDFNEKVVWLNLNWQSELIKICSDKIKVHDYARSKGLPEITNEVYTYADRAEDLDWESLPQKFVLKTNNASATNIVVLDKDNFDKAAAIAQLNEWLKINFSLHTSEMQYQHIDAKIFAEKFIESDEEIPTDYKFFCFNGEPKFLSVTTGRTAETLKEDLVKVHYDLDWNRIFIMKDDYEPDRSIELEKPRNFDKMVESARILAQDFPFVRVDFYEGDDEPVLGEMTFTPTAGKSQDYTDEMLKTLGDWIELPDEILKGFVYR